MKAIIEKYSRLQDLVRALTAISESKIGNYRVYIVLEYVTKKLIAIWQHNPQRTNFAS